MTPEELREITNRAMFREDDIARRWLENTGFKVMHGAASQGKDFCHILRNPYVERILVGMGYKVRMLSQDEMIVSWGE